jgi:hypothetical protein
VRGVLYPCCTCDVHLSFSLFLSSKPFLQLNCYFILLIELGRTVEMEMIDFRVWNQDLKLSI